MDIQLKILPVSDDYNSTPIPIPFEVIKDMYVSITLDDRELLFYQDDFVKLVKTFGI